MKIDLKRWQKAEAKRREIMTKYGNDNHAAAALDAIRALARAEPLLPSLQIDLVSLAIAVSEYNQALSAAGRLMKLAPGNFAAMRCAADAYQMLGCEAKAMAAWRSVTAPGQRAAALAAMARVAERAGRMAEAAELIGRALALDPRDAMTVLIAGRLAGKRGELDHAAELLERCTHPVVPAGLRSQAFYELGEIHDRLGDLDAAVGAWRAAKQCLEEGFPEEVELGRRIRLKVLANNRALCQALTPALVCQWRGQVPATPLPPLAVLAGHPRSGTTLLEQVLAAHPQVCDIDEKDALACAVRETLFPNAPDGPNLADLGQCPPEALAVTRRDYLRRAAMLRDITPTTGLILDKNPNLTDFLPFLLRPFPEVKLLVARRDPRDILLSCFRLPVLPQSGNVGWLREYHAVEDYHSLMNVWEKLRECLGDDPGWLEVSYENLCTDFENEARKITGFLGLDWHPAQANYRQTRADSPAASPSYAAVRAPVHTASIGRWQRYADLLPGLFGLPSSPLEARLLP
jgi:tetratricopeptide (TPR) repeat protein